MRYRRSSVKSRLSQWRSAAGRLSMLLAALILISDAGCQNQTASPSTEPEADVRVSADAEPMRLEAEAEPVDDLRVDLAVDTAPTSMEPPTAERDVDSSEPEPIRDPVETAESQTSRGPELVTVAPGVFACQSPRMVKVEATVCIEAGWLEQIACVPATREHESLVVVEAKPSAVHAALLVAGFQSGRPGYWTLDDNDEYLFEAPRGDGVRIDVAWTDAAGAAHETSIEHWIRDHRGTKAFPDCGWVFGGSVFEVLTEGGEPQYIADLTGSIVGLVTFGDEVVGFAEVLSDQEAVQAPEWEVNTATIPPIGTPVTLIFRPHDGSSPQPAP